MVVGVWREGEYRDVGGKVVVDGYWHIIHVRGKPVHPFLALSVLIGSAIPIYISCTLVMYAAQ